MPEALRGGVIEQMKAFAGDGHVAEAFEALLDQPPFSNGALEDVDEGSGQLIRVAAIVEPKLAMRAIEQFLGNRSAEDLSEKLTSGWRGFVEALEILIWFDETFDRAASSLLRLALAETETWSNNATGILRGVFGVYLGGTSVSYGRRLDWTRTTLAHYPEATGLLVQGLGKALDTREMRGKIDFASRTAPPEWKPPRVDDEIQARRGALQILLELAREGRELSAIGTVIAAGLRSAARRGLVQDLLTGIPVVEWPPPVRTKLGKAIEHLIRYDKAPSEITEQMRELHTVLVGTSEGEQLQYLLSLAPWQLFDHGQPDKLVPLLGEVAASIAAGGDTAILDAADQSLQADSYTTIALFRRLAEATPHEMLLLELERCTPLPTAAVLGYFAGLAHGLGQAWALDNLDRWLCSDLGGLVVWAAHLLPASDDLADRAIQAARQGACERGELGRLLYGGWTRSLSVQCVAEIASTLGDTSDARELEHALGIISLWIEANPGEYDPELERVALHLLSVAARTLSDRSSMVTLHRKQIGKGLVRSFNNRLTLITDRLAGLDEFLDEHDLELVDELAHQDPTLTIGTVIAAILGENETNSRQGTLWMQNSRLLSRLASATSEAAVIEQIQLVPEQRWRELVAHINFAIDQPNALIRLLVTESGFDPVVAARAALHIIYPEDGWSGPESNFLRGRRSVVSGWLVTEEDSTMQQWMRNIILEIDERIKGVEIAEAEER